MTKPQMLTRECAIIGVLVAALALFGCTTTPAPQGTEATLQRGPAETQAGQTGVPGGAEGADLAAGPEGAKIPEGSQGAAVAEGPCLMSSWSDGWAEWQAGESQVTARVFLKDEPHVSSPIQAEFTEFPLTIGVEFSGPVDTTSFDLAVVNSCGTRSQIQQVTTWVSDRQAEVLVRSVPSLEMLRVGFGGGKDSQGLEVGVPPFRFLAAVGRPVTVFSQVVGGGEPVRLWEGRTALKPRAISPDGRYLLLSRPTNFLMHPQFIQIPYLLDLETGESHTFARGSLSAFRWDLDNGALWVNGWRRIRLDGTEDTGDELLQIIPGGDEDLLAAELSPNGRWLAVLKMTDPTAGMYGVADFLLIDVTTQEVRTLPGAFGYTADQPEWMRLQWAPDSSALLLPSYDEQSVPRFLLLNPVDLSQEEFPVRVGEYSYASWSPGGQYVAVAKAGVFTRDGNPVFEEPHLWGVDWSQDDRYAYLSHTDPPQILEIATSQLEDAGMKSYILQLSGDGRIFWAE